MCHRPFRLDVRDTLPAVLDDPLSLGTGLVVRGSAQLVALKLQGQTGPHAGHLESHTGQYVPK